jgi:hypothetical protein
VDDNLYDRGSGSYQIGGVPLDIYVKWTVEGAYQLVNTNLDLSEDWFELDLQGTTPQRRDAQFMAYYTLAMNQRDPSEQFIVKANCSDPEKVNKFFAAQKNSTRLLLNINETMECNGFIWDWRPQEIGRQMSVSPIDTSGRRLSGMHPLDVLSSEKRNLISSGCSAPDINYRVPIDKCVLDNYWFAGFYGYLYAPDPESNDDGVIIGGGGGVNGIGNARVFDRPLGAQTAVVYEQQGATAGLFILPILWFLGWIIMGRWDESDRDRIYDLKRKGRRGNGHMGAVFGSALKLGTAFAPSSKQLEGIEPASNLDDTSLHRFKVDQCDNANPSLKEVSTDNCGKSEAFDMFPAQHGLLHECSSMSRFFHTLLREHHFSSMWSHASLALPRNMRYLAIWSHMLAIIFANALLITSVAVMSRDCTVLSTEAECLAPLEVSAGMGKYSFLGECEWQSERTDCIRAALPNTFIFSASFTLMALCIATAINAFLWHFFWNGICPKQPRLEDIGWDSKYWLNLPADYLHDDEEVLEITESTKLVEVTEEKLEALDVELSHLYHESSTLYNIHTKKEAIQLIKDAVTRIHRLQLKADDVSFTEMKAIMHLLRVNPDGSPRPLTLWEGLRFGNRRSLLEHELEEACDKSVDIVQELAEFGRLENDCKDVVLIQHFALSHFDAIKRVVLRKELFQFDNAGAGTVTPYVWFFGWAMVGAICLCMMIFVGVTMLLADLPSTLTYSWCYFTFFTIVQESLLVIPLKLWVLHVVLMKSITPQLRQVYHTLNTLATQKLQDNHLETNVNINKHTCGACRASRLGDVRDLAASKLLRNVTDVDMISCKKYSDVQANTYASLLVCIPATLSTFSEELGLMSYDMVSTLHLCVGILCLAYLVTNFVAIFVSLVLFVTAYIAYLYLWRKPYLKKIRSRGASGNRGWASRKFNSDGKPKSALRLTSPRYMVNKVLNLVPTERHAICWRNINRPAIQQGAVVVIGESEKCGQGFFAQFGGDIARELPDYILPVRRNFFATRQLIKWSKDMIHIISPSMKNQTQLKHLYQYGYEPQGIDERYLVAETKKYFERKSALESDASTALSKADGRLIGDSDSGLTGDSDTWCSESDIYDSDHYDYSSDYSGYSYSAGYSDSYSHPSAYSDYSGYSGYSGYSDYYDYSNSHGSSDDSGSTQSSWTLTTAPGLSCASSVPSETLQSVTKPTLRSFFTRPKRPLRLSESSASSSGTKSGQYSSAYSVASRSMGSSSNGMIESNTQKHPVSVSFDRSTFADPSKSAESLDSYMGTSVDTADTTDTYTVSSSISRSDSSSLSTTKYSRNSNSLTLSSDTLSGTRTVSTLYSSSNSSRSSRNTDSLSGPKSLSSALYSSSLSTKSSRNTDTFSDTKSSSSSSAIKSKRTSEGDSSDASLAGSSLVGSGLFPNNQSQESVTIDPAQSIFAGSTKTASLLSSESDIISYTTK